MDPLAFLQNATCWSHGKIKSSIQEAWLLHTTVALSEDLLATSGQRPNSALWIVLCSFILYVYGYQSKKTLAEIPPVELRCAIQSFINPSSVLLQSKLDELLFMSNTILTSRVFTSFFCTAKPFDREQSSAENGSVVQFSFVSGRKGLGFFLLNLVTQIQPVYFYVSFEVKANFHCVFSTDFFKFASDGSFVLFPVP